MAGETVECPNCKNDTTLLLSKAPKPPPAPPNQKPAWADLAAGASTVGKSQGETSSSATTPPPKQQSPIQHTDGSPHIENTLETIGQFFLWVGILGGIAAGFCFLSLCTESFGSGEEMITEKWIVLIGILAAFQGVVLKTLFFALAEVIRLLRRNSK
jgi:hypothetical protein